MSGDPPDTERGLHQAGLLPPGRDGLTGAASGAPVPSATISLSSGRRYEMEATLGGDRLVVRGRTGEIILQMEITDAGPVLSFAAPDGERAGSRRGGRGSGSSVPPRRAASPPQSVIVPMSSGKRLPSEGEADEAVEVPRALPLPSIRSRPRPICWSSMAATRGRGSPSGDRPASSTRAAAGPGRAGAPASAERASLRPRRGATFRARGARYPRSAFSSTRSSAPSRRSEAASSFDQALLRHGIADRDLWKAVDRSWQDRLEREPILTLRWMELTTRYREHLTRR